MPTIETIFFDWGGVIANDPGDDFLKDLLRSIGANETQIDEIYDGYMRAFMRGELTEAQYWSELETNYGLHIHDTISEEFTAWRGLAVNDDILGLVTSAKAAGKKTALLSNIIEPSYNVLARAGHFTVFDEVIASCKVGFAKPQTEIYDLSLERLHATAEKSLFIDDKERNLAPATTMGFTTILAQNPEQIIRDITSYIS